MRSALAARMYAAVQLSSQQQQMYVENNIKKKEQNEFITYQRFIRKFFFSLSMCIQWPFFLHSAHQRKTTSAEFVDRGAMCGCLLHMMTMMMTRIRGAEKNQRRKIFSFARFFLFSLALGICTIARRAYRWRKKVNKKLFLSVKKSEAFNDGQAMK